MTRHDEIKLIEFSNTDRYMAFRRERNLNRIIKDKGGGGNLKRRKKKFEQYCKRKREEEDKYEKRDPDRKKKLRK